MSELEIIVFYSICAHPWQCGFHPFSTNACNSQSFLLICSLDVNLVRSLFVFQKDVFYNTQAQQATPKPEKAQISKALKTLCPRPCATLCARPCAETLCGKACAGLVRMSPAHGRKAQGFNYEPPPYIYIYIYIILVFVF